MGDVWNRAVSIDLFGIQGEEEEEDEEAVPNERGTSMEQKRLGRVKILVQFREKRSRERNNQFDKNDRLQYGAKCTNAAGVR